MRIEVIKLVITSELVSYSFVCPCQFIHIRAPSIKHPSLGKLEKNIPLHLRIYLLKYHFPDHAHSMTLGTLSHINNELLPLFFIHEERS